MCAACSMHTATVLGAALKPQQPSCLPDGHHQQPKPGMFLAYLLKKTRYKTRRLAADGHVCVRWLEHERDRKPRLSTTKRPRTLKVPTSQQQTYLDDCKIFNMQAPHMLHTGRWHLARRCSICNAHTPCDCSNQVYEQSKDSQTESVTGQQQSPPQLLSC
jgi:hypothetical protein